MSTSYRDKLLRTARLTTGLSDFGPEDFLEPLDLLIKGYQSSAELNFKGEIGTRVYLHRMLCNRLRLHHYHQQQPQLGQNNIVAPLFIIGLPRTGSTLLHELLAKHSRLRAPTFWETTFVPGRSAIDRLRQIATALQIRTVDLLAPGFRRIHSLGTFRPHECVTLQAQSFRSMQFHAAHNVEQYNAWLSHCDWQPAYTSHQQNLQWLQHEQAPKRWVLKAPGHLLAVKTIIATYPDATFIQLHRHPAEVIPSMASLYQHLRKPFSDRVNPDEIGRDVTRQWFQGLTSTMELRQTQPLVNRRFIDVDYTDLLADPIDAVRVILKSVDEDLDQATQARMQRYLDRHPKGQHGVHHYRLEAFGLNAAALNEMFADYTRTYLNP